MGRHCPLSGLINQNRNMSQWHEIMFSAVRVKGFRRMTKDIWARQKCYSISNCISPLFGEIWNKIVQIKSSAAAAADPEILLGPIETHCWWQQQASMDKKTWRDIFEIWNMIFGDRCFIIENDHLVELFSVLKTVLSFFCASIWWRGKGWEAWSRRGLLVGITRNKTGRLTGEQIQDAAWPLATALWREALSGRKR